MFPNPMMSHRGEVGATITLISARVLQADLPLMRHVMANFVGIKLGVDMGTVSEHRHVELCFAIESMKSSTWVIVSLSGK